MSLSFAATIPDRIKSWDCRGGEDDPHGFKLLEHPKIEAQLRAFLETNRPGPQNDALHPSRRTVGAEDTLDTRRNFVGGQLGVDWRVGFPGAFSNESKCSELRLVIWKPLF